MPNYTFNHIHHEAVDVHAAAAWYKKLFGATNDPPFERGGATWVPVHIGAVQITVTDREFAPMELGRYQGYDHLALVSDDFDQTLADIAEHGVEIWMGPVTLADGNRIVLYQRPGQRQDRADGAKLSGNPPLRPVAQLPLARRVGQLHAPPRCGLGCRRPHPRLVGGPGAAGRARLPGAGGRPARAQHRALGARSSRLRRR